MFDWRAEDGGPGRHGRCGGGPRGGRVALRPLPDFSPGAEVWVVCNRDRRTLEMGLCAGARVRVIENRPGDPSMVVAAGDGRYVLAKAAAAHIRAR